MDQVVDKTQQTAGKVADQAKKQATSAISNQKDRAVDSLGSVAQAIRQTSQELREQDNQTVGRYADTVAQQVERLASYLRTKDVPDLLEDIGGVARRQPAIFLGTALTLGALGARFLMSSAERARNREHALHAMSQPVAPAPRGGQRPLPAPPMPVPPMPAPRPDNGQRISSGPLPAPAPARPAPGQPPIPPVPSTPAGPGSAGAPSATGIPRTSGTPGTLGSTASGSTASGSTASGSMASGSTTPGSIPPARPASGAGGA